MSEGTRIWDQNSFDRKMKESQAELTTLRLQLKNLLVKFSLRALRTYQAARNIPLTQKEIENLVKYELSNVANDLSEREAVSSVIEQVKLEWEKQH